MDLYALALLLVAFLVGVVAGAAGLVPPMFRRHL